MRALCLSTLMLASCWGPETVVLERSSCLSCHRPVDTKGQPHGIEKAHPQIAGKDLSCTDCHGGNSGAYKQSEAHVLAAPGAEPYVKNLTLGELDDVPEDYLRFINPGDLRVAATSCGAGGCHGDLVEKVKTNQMATFSGELGVARYRAGAQRSGASVKGIYDARDPSFRVGEVPGTVGSLAKMEEPRLAGAPVNGEHPPVGELWEYQDLYLTKACMRCHLWSFGDNKFPGDFRSSGCTACHMNYSNDGLSQSADPTAVHDTPAHPKRHELTTAVTTEQCMHCHYRGGRIGPSFIGMREGAGAGLDPPNVATSGEALHGHDADYYIVDEDTTNDHDETPPDVHFQAGMDCIDCHTSHDLHGDGHLYSDSNLAVEVRCQTCHGTADAPSDLKTRLGNPMKSLSQDDTGEIWLTTKVKKLRLRVPQIKPAIDSAAPTSYLHRSMGRDESGFSHLDTMSCDACHSGWVPTCYGCHVEVDMGSNQRSLISGNSTVGRIAGSRRWVATDDLILMFSTDGRITPSMPAERMFMTVFSGSGEKVVDKQIRRSMSGDDGHGHRAFHPHTTQRWSPFMRCDRCHTVAQDEANAALLDVVMGFGSERYIETDGDGVEHRLDQVQTRDHEPIVLVGHDEPLVSGPLTAAVVARMRAVVVEAADCPVPGDVAVPWSIIQDSIMTPSCSSARCHSSADAAGGLDLSAEAAPASLVNRPSTLHGDALLVVPGDPSKSYLLNKIVETAERSGQRMPTTGDPLAPCQIDMIRGWIRAGARGD
jgi:hypothetical protein